jgi:catalase
MRSFQSVAMSIAFSALMAAGATCAGAEDKPLGVQLVDQMNALYGAHPGVRANHAKGAVFEGLFTPAQGADALSSAVFLKGAPTPLVIRFSKRAACRTRPTPTLRPTVSAVWRSSSISRMGVRPT